MQTSTTTSITGAMLGSAVGCVVVYLVEILATTDVPAAVEAALVIICTALVSLVWPANPPA